MFQNSKKERISSFAEINMINKAYIYVYVYKYILNFGIIIWMKNTLNKKTTEDWAKVCESLHKKCKTVWWLYVSYINMIVCVCVCIIR